MRRTAMKPGRLLWHLLLGFGLLLVFPGVAVALWESAMQLGFHPHVRIMAAGVVLGMCLDRVLAPGVPVIAVAEHELTHVLVGLPFGYVPYIFVATPRGGYVRQFPLFPILAPVAEALIDLAPYFLPTFTVITVALRPWVPEPWLWTYDGWAGLTLGWHAESTRKEVFRRVHDPWNETRGFQSDIAKNGILFSGIYILVMGAAVHGVIFAAVCGEFPGLESWWGAVRDVTGGVLAEIWTLLFSEGRLSDSPA